MKKLISAVFLLSMAAASQLSAAAVFVFSIDTSSLNGTAENVDFQLSAGGAAVTTVISGFTTDGTYTPANIALMGDATGTLDTTVTLNNTTSFNDAFQPIMLGNLVQFTATLSGPGIDTPNSAGTAFGFSIYDASGMTALLTTSGDGTIAGIEADSLNGVEIFTNPTGAGPSVATVAAVPEPGSLALLAFGSLALAGVRRRMA